MKVNDKKLIIFVVFITILISIIYFVSYRKNEDQISTSAESINDTNNVITVPNIEDEKLEENNTIVNDVIIQEDIQKNTEQENFIQEEKNKENSKSNNETLKTNTNNSTKKEETTQSVNTSNKTTTENQTIIVEENDDKYLINQDEGQWYTKSDWFEIDGDVAFFETN